MTTMQIETYECQESVESTVDDKEQVVALVEKLELKGRQSLICGEKSQICPYREMTEEENFVYSTILPERKEACRRFSPAPMPLRVLQVLSHALSIGFFNNVFVWSAESIAESIQVKDPLLVGYTGQYNFSPDKIYMLARWGEILLPMSELRTQAVKMYKEKMLSELKHRSNLIETVTDAYFFSRNNRTSLQDAIR
jgi:hypothetical protein